MINNEVVGKEVKTRPYYMMILVTWLLQYQWLFVLLLNFGMFFYYDFNFLAGFTLIGIFFGGYPTSLAHVIKYYILHVLGIKKRYIHLDKRGELLSVTSDPVFKGLLSHNSKN